MAPKPERRKQNAMFRTGNLSGVDKYDPSFPQVFGMPVATPHRFYKEHIGLKASSSDQLTFWPDESLSARREPQCPTKASVPDESKLELVQLAPRTAPRTTPRIRKLI